MEKTVTVNQTCVGCGKEFASELPKSVVSRPKSFICFKCADKLIQGKLSFKK